MIPEKITPFVEPHEVVRGNITFTVYGEEHDPLQGGPLEPGHVLRAAQNIANIWGNWDGRLVDLGITAVIPQGKVPQFETYPSCHDLQIEVYRVPVLIDHGNEVTTWGCKVMVGGDRTFQRKIEIGQPLCYLVFVDDSK